MTLTEIPGLTWSSANARHEVKRMFCEPSPAYGAPSPDFRGEGRALGHEEMVLFASPMTTG